MLAATVRSFPPTRRHLGFNPRVCDGRNEPVRPEELVEVVSTHTPMCGRYQHADEVRTALHKFQRMRPWWTQPAYLRFLISEAEFQPTRPRWTRHTTSSLATLATVFQPTRP